MLYRLRRIFLGIRRLKLWQKTLLIVLLIGLVVGLPVAYGGSDGGSAAGASGESNTEIYLVQYGDLTSTIYASGSLDYSTSEQLTFGSAGTVEAVYVEKDDAVKAGDVLARLDSESIESLEESVARARISVRDAEEALEDAQDPYSESDIEDAREAVEQAQLQLLDAQERGEIKVANAEYAADKACQKYSDSLLQYFTGQISFDEHQQAVRDLAIAELDLEMARINADKSVSSAEDALENAEETLEEMLAGADPLEVALKQSQLDSARVTLDNALEQLESAREGYPIVAPFDGVVADINVAPGDEVNANTVVIELVDSSAFEMSASVDEIDVAQLRLGQGATVTLDAISDTELSGNVSSLSAFAQSQSGVVSYPITISLDVPEGIQLLEGMSATATIEIELASDALLVPSSAITGTGDRSIVMVMVDGQPQPRMVTLGATDGVQTEVVTGLGEGDEVIVEVGTATGDSSSQEMQEEFMGPGGFTMPDDGGGFVVPDGGGGGFMPR